MLREKFQNIDMLYGGAPSKLWDCLLFIVVPAVLLAMFLLLILGERSRNSRDGVLMGFAVALWTSASWLTGSYLGAWLNLLPGTIVAVLFGGLLEGRNSWLFELLVVAVNFLLWPIVGWLVFRTIAKLVPPDPASPGP